MSLQPKMRYIQLMETPNGQKHTENTVKSQDELASFVSQRKSLLYLFYALAVMGIGVAAYVYFTISSGGEVVCGLGDCGIVNNSKYAFIYGIPVSGYGLLYYSLIFALLLTKKYRWMFLISIVGLLFSAYLTFIEAFVIEAWCQWCVMSAWISTSIFILSAYTWFKHQKSKA